MTTEELQAISEWSNACTSNDYKQLHPFYEIALKLSEINDKLPDEGSSSKAELQSMNEGLGDELLNLKERYGALVDKVKQCRLHIDNASICSKPSEIYEHLRRAKNCLDPNR